ncbi:MAG: sigma-70 family RNA polymerase sigma factor [Oscillospiraceae bacterium]|nr:sigma-70 family RNA polymerase sigma factor [Oscillospiraceae bacterium]
MEQKELLEQAHRGDRAAQEEFLRSNRALIWSIVHRFTGRGTETEDLFQLGCLGFIKAVEGYDSSYGTCFSTYAVPKIAGEIRRYLRDDGPVKVSRTLRERAAALEKARSRLLLSFGREPLLSEIAAETGLSPEEAAEALGAFSAVESYQQENGDSALTLEELLGDGGRETEQTVTALQVRTAVAALPEKQRQVIALRYFHALTQQRCASILAVSQVQISRLEKKALAALRELLREED